MASFPITYSKRLPQAVQQPSGDVGGELVAEQLVRAGNAMHQFGSDLREKARLAEKETLKNKIYAETQNGKIAIQEYDSETKRLLENITDIDEIERIGRERLEKRSGLFQSFATTPESRQALDFYTRETAIGLVEHIEKKRYERSKQDAFVSFDTLYQKQADSGNFDVLEPLAAQAYQNGVITDKQYRNYAEKVPALKQKFNLEQIRAQSQDYVSQTGDKKGAYAIIEKAYKDGLIDAEGNKILGDSLDNFVRGRIQQDTNNRYAETINNYKLFTEQLQAGQLSFDAIGNTTMVKEDKNKWESYVKGSYDTPPAKSLLAGHKEAVGIVMKHNVKQLSDKEAYDALLTERYVKHTISEDEFRWGIRRIQKPYPDYLLPDIRATLKRNEAQTKSLWGLDEAKAQEYNTAYLNWLDKRLEKGEEPSPKEMYIRAAQYRAGSYELPKSAYRIGSTIQRAGKTWEIVGFDTDGEPLVEEVK